MSDAQSITQEINNMHAYIVRSVDRFINQQTISTENYRKLSKIKTDASNIIRSSQKIWEILTTPHNLEIQASQRMIEAEYQPRNQQLQSEYQLRSQQTQNNSVLQSQVQQEYQTKQQALELEKRAKIQLKNEEIEKKNLKVESKELASLLQELESVLNLFVETEKSIKGEEITKKAAQDFAANKDNFDKAASYHKKMAVTILAVLALVLVGGIMVLYFFFAKSNRIPDLPTTPSLGLLIAILTTTLSGKIAFLLVWAWTLRYIANLHSIHSEQAVIYNDRSVSLSIAENLLVAAPQLEQKTSLLNTLAKGYLDIEKNAFRSEGGTKKNGETATQLGLLKELVDTVKPLLESLRTKDK